MIRRYFYIFSATLFILITPVTGVKANIDEDRLEELARHTNSPPDGFNYQAVLRDVNGEILANSSVTMRFTLSNSNDDVWIETHSLTSNEFGVVSLIIGDGTNIGGTANSFAEIDWSADISVKVEADTGDGFVDLGTSSLQSVPYAEYAANGLTSTQAASLDAIDLNAEENVQADWNVSDNTADAFILNKPAIPSDINELSDEDGLLSDISGDLTVNSLAIEGAFSLPTTDGSNAQFLAALGNGTTVWADPLFMTDNIANDAITADKIADGVIPSFAGDGNYSFVGVRSGNYAYADHSFIGGGRYHVADGSYSAVVGGESNYAMANYSFVGGGKSNMAYSIYSTVSGGNGNQANSSFSTVSGGRTNNASGSRATIGGGQNNTASGSFSTLSGGAGNTTTGESSTIGGGQNNSTPGIFSTVGGGFENIASGNFSLVPGGRGLQTSSYSAVVLGINNSTTGGTSYSFVAADPLLVVGNGTVGGIKSDALVMLKNGNTDINGTFVANSLGVDGAFTLPTADGTNGQVLTTNGNGSVTWGDISGNNPTVVRNATNIGVLSIPDNTAVYISSLPAGSGIVRITMPTSNTAGDKIILSMNTTDPSLTRSLIFETTTATIVGHAANTVTCALNNANPTMELIYDGATWLAINGNFNFPDPN
ncbi:hypothetical protein [Ekhidna sp.]